MVLAGDRASGHVSAVRCREGAGTALPPGDHRPGGRQMFPGRFWVPLGSGEASNEHTIGERWPPKPVRNDRLKECVDVMRALFAGETVSHSGLVTVDRARLWTLPQEPPALIGAAVSVAARPIRRRRSLDRQERRFHRRAGRLRLPLAPPASNRQEGTHGVTGQGDRLKILAPTPRPRSFLFADPEVYRFDFGSEKALKRLHETYVANDLAVRKQPAAIARRDGLLNNHFTFFDAGKATATLIEV